MSVAMSQRPMWSKDPTIAPREQGYMIRTRQVSSSSKLPCEPLINETGRPGYMRRSSAVYGTSNSLVANYQQYVCAWNNRSGSDAQPAQRTSPKHYEQSAEKTHADETAVDQQYRTRAPYGLRPSSSCSNRISIFSSEVQHTSSPGQASNESSKAASTQTGRIRHEVETVAETARRSDPSSHVLSPFSGDFTTSTTSVPVPPPVFSRTHQRRSSSESLESINSTRSLPVNFVSNTSPVALPKASKNTYNNQNGFNGVPVRPSPLRRSYSHTDQTSMQANPESSSLDDTIVNPTTSSLKLSANPSKQNPNLAEHPTDFKLLDRHHIRKESVSNGLWGFWKKKKNDLTRGTDIREQLNGDKGYRNSIQPQKGYRNSIQPDAQSVASIQSNASSIIHSISKGLKRSFLRINISKAGRNKYKQRDNHGDGCTTNFPSKHLEPSLGRNARSLSVELNTDLQIKTLDNSNESTSPISAPGSTISTDSESTLVNSANECVQILPKSIVKSILKTPPRPAEMWDLDGKDPNRHPSEVFAQEMSQITASIVSTFDATAMQKQKVSSGNMIAQPLSHSRLESFPGNLTPPLLPHNRSDSISSLNSISTARRSIRFEPRVVVHDTWHAIDYDRRGEPATCNKLTAQLAQLIREEMNQYKLDEMIVHERSRHLTHFF